MPAYTLGFVLEQALGHVTHAKNLQLNVPSDPEVRALWGLIPFEVAGLSARIPVYKSNWTVRAGLRARRVVAGLMRQAPLEALFFHTQVPAILAQNWLKRIPSIVSLDATPLQYDRLGAFYQHAQGPGWLEALKWRLNRDCYRHARHLVAWAEWTKRGLVDEYEVPATKITVIPPGVNVADWRRPTPRTRHDDPVKILFVGANLERKGGMLLLDAFRSLRPLGVELHLVTKDPVVPEPGLFVYAQMQPNSQPLKDLYHRCDIFALPTFGDCLPMVLSEAGAAGMAMVSTKVAAIPEIVRDGETGLTVPVGDVSGLTEALRRLILDPALRLQVGERAIAHVTQSYDAQKNATRLLDLLKHEVDLARVKARRTA
ncbi:glycosyltransferase family 4 protein [Candidatus Oscillochloris fontis]|uniref:glycosyltransferase family 4 protein n=1 Tax=Candidatus Oscillochloris fontis TaxID=2496868 RepID=UPI00101CD6FE|nr:glycosyltransferase family 4 protein [Candidatus Oscillochloris fontis]